MCIQFAIKFFYIVPRKAIEKYLILLWIKTHIIEMKKRGSLSEYLAGGLRARDTSHRFSSSGFPIKYDPRKSQDDGLPGNSYKSSRTAAVCGGRIQL